MSYKERYKKQKERNKTLIDRIDDLKLQLSSYNTTKNLSPISTLLLLYII